MSQAGKIDTTRSGNIIAQSARRNGMLSRKIWIKSNRKRKGSPYTAFKVLLWVGAILSAIIFGASFGSGSPIGAITFLVELAISIPVAILNNHAINAAESRSDIIPLAILAIVFCSRIAKALIIGPKRTNGKLKRTRMTTAGASRSKAKQGI